jgi:hypothetical protein
MALSPELRNLIKTAAEVNDQKFASRQMHEILAAVTNWVASHDSQFTLSGSAPAGGALSAIATVSLKDAAGKVDVFNQTASVVLTASGGTGPTLNGATGPVTVTMVDGQSDVIVTNGATGTVALAMSSPTPSGLTVTGTLNVVFS